MIRSTLAAALLIGLSLQPTAQAEEVPNIAGWWTFTATLPVDCDFGGNVFIEKTGDGAYQAELTATQTCPLLEYPWIVRQDCDVSLLGRQASVRCEIKEFIQGYEDRIYYPDNFTLTIESSKRMYGALVSAGGASPAEWVRNEAGIS